MEVLGSVSAVVQLALTLADKFLNEANGPKKDIEQLEAFLSQFQWFIRDQEAKHQDSHVSRDLVNAIIDLTDAIEDAIDKFAFSVSVTHRQTACIGPIISNFINRTDKSAAKKLASHTERIKKSIAKLKLTERLAIKDADITSRSWREVPWSHQFFVEDEMVGFGGPKEELLQQLLSSDPKRATIQVVGPGGSGKTFLVKNVFGDAEVKKHFQCVAWIQADSDREVWVEELLEQMCSPKDQRKILNEEAGNSEQILKRHLADKRYLVVLDNVWRRYQYTLIVNNLLPDNISGSRIIITTRNSGLADKPDFTHRLNGLAEKEAWSLFSVRAFGDQRDKACPPELRAVSEEILKRCEGMPLALVSVSSLLARERLVENTWMRFNERLGSELGINSNYLPIASHILQPSFTDLPDKLRSCFLYFSLFPENADVSRGRLIRSWMAEGFLDRPENPEEAAESCLNELVERSLLRVSESEIDGRVRSCKLLRLHHQLIVPLSESGNFVTVFGRKSERRQQSTDVKARRVSVQSDDFAAELSRINNLSRVSSLFAFGKINSFRSALNKITEMHDSHELEELFGKLRLIKVLDLQGVPLTKLPNDVGSFSLLKCLNLRGTNLESVPRSVQYLSCLETLDLKHTLVSKLPKGIVKLKNLRHLIASYRGGQGVIVSSASIGALSSLQELSLINVKNHKDFKFSDLESLVQLKKLGVTDLEEGCGINLCNAVKRMKNLLRLEVGAAENNHLELDHLTNPPKHIRCLQLKGLLRKLPRWISNMENLVRVVLKWSKLDDEQSPLQGLEDMPRLMELEMVDYYTGTSLMFREGTFKNLKKLHVERFDNLTEVVVESQALTKLERLTVCKCGKLKPLRLCYSLRRLEELVVYEMNRDFMDDIQNRLADGGKRSCRYVS